MRKDTFYKVNVLISSEPLYAKRLRVFDYEYIVIANNLGQVSIPAHAQLSLGNDDTLGHVIAKTASEEHIIDLKPLGLSTKDVIHAFNQVQYKKPCCLKKLNKTVVGFAAGIALTAVITSCLSSGLRSQTVVYVPHQHAAQHYNAGGVGIHHKAMLHKHLKSMEKGKYIQRKSKDLKTSDKPFDKAFEKASRKASAKHIEKSKKHHAGTKFEMPEPESANIEKDSQDDKRFEGRINKDMPNQFTKPEHGKAVDASEIEDLENEEERTEIMAKDFNSELANKQLKKVKENQRQMRERIQSAFKQLKAKQANKAANTEDDGEVVEMEVSEGNDRLPNSFKINKK